MKNIIKRANIKVSDISGPDISKTIESNMIQILGIHDIRANHRNSKVYIDYNLKFINFKSISDKLSALGCPPSKTLFNALKKSFIIFTEKNELEGLGMNVSRFNAHTNNNLDKS